MPSIIKMALVNDTAERLEGGGRVYTETYRVQTDEPWRASAVEQTGDPALPVRGDSHQDNPLATARSVSVQRNPDSHTEFTWEVSYSTVLDDAEIGQEENPLEDAHIVRWNSQEADEAYYVDQNGKKVLNSIGQQFEELPTRASTAWEVAVTVNQSSFDVSQASEFAGKPTVNSGSITIADAQSTWIIPADNALLVEYRPGALQERNGVRYYAVTYRWKLNPDGWNASEKYLDYGTYEKSGNDWVPIEDGNGEEITERFPLDGAGSRVTDASAGAAEMSFVPYAEKNHALLEAAS